MGYTLMRLTRLLPLIILAVSFALTSNVFAADPVGETEGHAAEVAEETHGAMDAASDALEEHTEDADHAGGHEQRGLIDFKWQEALFTIIVFVIFFLVVSIGAGPKILASLQAREDKVRGDLKHAEDAAKEATATLEAYKKQLAEAQKQAQQIVEESRSAAQKVAAQLKDEAQTQITQVRERAEADINAAKERAVADIYETAGALATQIAGQILRREINAGDQATLIRESIDKLRQADNN